MMKSCFLVTGIALLAVGASGAWAEEPAGAGTAKQRRGKGGQSADMIFKKLDTNSDGKLTLEEFRKMAELRPNGKLKDNPGMIGKLFERMDANGDGYVTLAEFKQFRAKMAERMKNGKPGEKEPDADK
jgi:hypothetical protein